MTKRTNIFKKTNFLLLILSASILIPISSFAVGGQIIDATIVRTLNARAYGGCMIQVDTAIQNAVTADGSVVDCPSSWLSADCDAVYHTQAQSNAMWSSALTAFTLQKKVYIVLYDTEKHNSYCVVNRLDVKR